MKENRQAPRLHEFDGFYVTVSVGSPASEQNPHSVHHEAEDAISDRKARLPKAKKAVAFVALGTAVAYLGVGLPVSLSMDQQGDRIMDEGLSPAQAALAAQLEGAKESLADEVNKGLEETSEEFQKEMGELFNQKIDEIFAETFPGYVEPPETTTTTTEVETGQ